MNPNVVSEEYMELQKQLSVHQKQLCNSIVLSMDFTIRREDLNAGLPVLSQLKYTPVPAGLYLMAVKKVETVLISHQYELKEELNRLTTNLTEEDVYSWIKHAITFNTEYFQGLAEKKQLSPWLPQFLAEHALRPFMQGVAVLSQSFINEFDVMGTCPCCGEPHRLAKLASNEQKYLCCSRCETQWKQHKVSCVHCGDDRKGNLFYISILEDNRAKIEVCRTCNNYLKLITMIDQTEVKSAALLDLETLHLDFVAQEEGFGKDI
ncbi:hypothetical protein CR203_13300 [Salipaludibacillus neizhouensis]|uniref:FdhE C-terminal domain-containing protein n=1 Tax=Salipaludibacillus neizhouensis TaxID=885475 RepID=A0A3A9KQ49_9BACI|nr:formate dehydrogenase accessory protein FdhE [Salipaludibacillus neizhouensis]RKL66806.1 hypothetical protein CR203_13300 [Salipaludibacillus neizhouensis]